MNTISARKATTAFNDDINVTCEDGKAFHGKFSGFYAWARENKVERIISCFSAYGRHGLYPSIIATTDTGAVALSAIRGESIAKDDGATFGSVYSARECYKNLVMSGLNQDNFKAAWSITEDPYKNPTKESAKDGQVELPF